MYKVKHNSVLVQIRTIADDKEHVIATYYTDNFEQTLKMFITARDNDIECSFNKYSEVVDKKYLQCDYYYVEEVYVMFGSTEDLPAIHVYIK